MKKPSPKSPGGLSRRIRFPEEEQRHPWLSALLDAYAVADTGVAVAVRDREKKRKERLACGRGCDVCCRQPDIPVYPHELPGIRWYLEEKLDAAVRRTVLRQLAEHRKGSPCPFLVDHACAVHAVRPIACRQYNVFTTPCAEGEDPFYTRRSDVLEPIEEYRDRAFAAVASFYGLERERDRTAVVRQIMARILNLQEYDWGPLARAVEKACSA